MQVTSRPHQEERFKSVAMLDEASLLATCACIHLDPVAAGITPEAGGLVSRPNHALAWVVTCS